MTPTGCHETTYNIYNIQSVLYATTVYVKDFWFQLGKRLLSRKKPLKQNNLDFCIKTTSLGWNMGPLSCSLVIRFIFSFDFTIHSSSKNDEITWKNYNSPNMFYLFDCVFHRLWYFEYWSKSRFSHTVAISSSIFLLFCVWIVGVGASLYV